MLNFFTATIVTLNKLIKITFLVLAVKHFCSQSFSKYPLENTNTRNGIFFFLYRQKIKYL